MVQGKDNPMLEEWDCKGWEHMEGQSEWGGGETDSGRICVAFGKNRGRVTRLTAKGCQGPRSRRKVDGRQTRSWCTCRANVEDPVCVSGMLGEGAGGYGRQAGHVTKWR